MKPSEALQQHRSEIRRIVQEHRAANVRVFGSVLTGQDTEGSDLDLLVDPKAGMTFFDIGAIRHHLKQLLGVEVDIVTPEGLAESVRRDVLAKAVAV